MLWWCDVEVLLVVFFYLFLREDIRVWKFDVVVWIVGFWECVVVFEVVLDVFVCFMEIRLVVGCISNGIEC